MALRSSGCREVCNLRVRQPLLVDWSSFFGGILQSLREQKAVGSDAHGCVMMKSGPAAAIVVRQPELLLKLAVVLFDAPAHLRGVDHIADAYIGRQIGQPILRGFDFLERPFDEQPLLMLTSW